MPIAEIDQVGKQPTPSTKPVRSTTFEEARTFFQDFLNERGESGPILWTFTEDTLSRRTDLYDKKFWLRLPLPSENESFAKACYTLAQQRGYGVGLSAYARCSEGLCCSIIIPADEEDAQYMLMDPNAVKYSIVNEMTSATEIRSPLKWKLMQLLPWAYQQGNFLVYLQSRRQFQIR